MNRILTSLVAALGLMQSAVLAANTGFAVRQSTDRLDITCDDRPVATYVFRDSKILRPYFANLYTHGRLQVTRTHPPVTGVDATDHETMHPGLWLAFGDINGQDFWRNKGRIEHVRFTEPPRVEKGQLTFTAENRLQSTNGQTIGTQISRVSFMALADGFLLVWQADFLPAEQELAFGDQEEMGLGVRVATKITEKNGGVIITSTGARTAKATWGKSFEWCDYSGEWDGRRVGVTLMPDPVNFRPSWFHNRDYGLMVANPFGRKAMQQGEISRVVVKQGGRLRLRFGVYLHAPPPGSEPDLPAAYRQFLTMKAAVASNVMDTAGMSAPLSEKIDAAPFVGGKEGYAVYRCSTLAVNSKGTVLAFCEGRVNSHKDEDDMDVVLKRSTDGGRTRRRCRLSWPPKGWIPTCPGSTTSNWTSVSSKRPATGPGYQSNYLPPKDLC